MVERIRRDPFVVVKERSVVERYSFFANGFHVLESELIGTHQVTKWDTPFGSLGAVPVVLRLQKDYGERYVEGQSIAVATIEHGRDNPVVDHMQLEGLLAGPERLDTLVLDEHFTSFRIDMHNASFGYDVSVPLRRGFIFAISEQDISPILVDRVKASGIYNRFDQKVLKSQLQNFYARFSKQKKKPT